MSMASFVTDFIRREPIKACTRPNYAEARRFLQALEPEPASSFTFVTLAEGVHSQRRGIHKQLIGTFEEHSRQLAELNSAGVGVFVTVNRTNGTGRKAVDVTAVRAIWQDDDSQFKGEYPIEPSIVVQTSAERYQRYWLVEPSTELLASFEAVMRTMVDEYGCDANARDLSRLLRVPGFLNHKREPRQVRMLSCEEKRYSLDEILQAFPAKVVNRPRRGVSSSHRVGEADNRKLASALEYIPADDRDLWFRIGAALHAEYGGSGVGFDIWNEWSQTTLSGNYDLKSQEVYWAEQFGRRDGYIAGLGTVYFEAGKRGWPSIEGNAFAHQHHRVSSFSTALAGPSGKLSQQILGDLRSTFATRNHELTADQWLALADLVGTIEGIADGKIKENYWLSSLDPGVGKTQTIIHSLKGLVASEAHEGVAALVCVGRLAEIEAMLGEGGWNSNDFAVLVSAETERGRHLNGQGNPERGEARILFTTQQMLESRILRDGSFGEAKDFQFGGHPRQLRIWDEACLPGKATRVHLTEIEGLLNEARRGNQKLFGILNDLAASVRNCGEAGLIELPRFSACGIDFDEAKAIFCGSNSSTQRDVLQMLWSNSGLAVAVSRYSGQPVVTSYEETLPSDIEPVVICDASGRVRRTYDLWEKKRGNLKRLKSASKDYSNLTINVWKKGASKAAWKEDPQVLLDGVLQALNSKPSERFLVVHHKPNQFSAFDLQSAILAQAGSPDRIEFTHWMGEEFRATNRFKDIPNVILAGTLFYEQPDYEALARLSGGIAPDERFSSDDRKEFESGEHAQLILQALCRGSVRALVNGRCGECTAYVIASAKSSIPSILRSGELFPGAVVNDWIPVERKPNGKVAEALEAVDAIMHSGLDIQLPVSALRNKIGIADRSNFRNDVLEHVDFRRHLSKRGISIVNRRGRGGSYLSLH